MTNTWGGQDSASGIVASFLLASNGAPGITYDNSIDGGNNGGTTNSMTYSYTIGSGSNRLLIVNLIGDTSADDISSVTYAGIPMTLIGKIQAPSNNWQYLYYLLSPASGSNNIAIAAGSSHYLISQAASWYNVKQTAAGHLRQILHSREDIRYDIPHNVRDWLIGGGRTLVFWTLLRNRSNSIVNSAIGGGIFVSSGSPVSPAGNVNMTTISDGTQSTGVIMASLLQRHSLGQNCPNWHGLRANVNSNEF
jgi:hypothetical protein